MTHDSKPGSPLAAALILGGLLAVLSLACCAIVAFAAFVLPNDSRALIPAGRAAAPLPTATPVSPETPASPALPASPATPVSPVPPPAMAELPAWMPDRSNLPAGMKLVEEKRTSNAMIASEYDNPENYLRQLESFGRIEGFSREYGSTDPCRTRGVRYVKMTLILNADSAGAQRYMESMESTDRDSENYQKIAIGEYGYQFWDSPNFEGCPDAPDERLGMILFRRGSVIGFVEVSAVAENNSDADILDVAEKIAQTLDAHIQGK